MILRCKFDKYINNNYHLLRLVDVLSIYKNFLFAYQFPPWEKWKASLLPFSKTKRSEAFRIREDSRLLYYRYRWFRLSWIEYPQCRLLLIWTAKKSPQIIFNPTTLAALSTSTSCRNLFLRRNSIRSATISADNKLHGFSFYSQSRLFIHMWIM